MGVRTGRPGTRVFDAIRFKQSGDYQSQKPAPILAFSSLLQNFVAFTKEPAKIGAQEQLREASKQWNRSGKSQNIFHLRHPILSFNEVVIVLEGSKCPAHHLVAEMAWSI